jgi:dipeptidyl aminopeptidase/acylaminoacyl peptidase
MLSRMHVSKRVSIVFLSILIVLLVVACGKQAGNVTRTINATEVNSTAVSGALTLVAQTIVAIPTSTVIPNDTAPIPTLPPTALPFKLLHGLRMAYIVDRNLYVQDSGKLAIQLTSSGQDRNPRFSEDGEKIVFIREWETEMNQLRVINADGTGEQALVSAASLITLGYYEFCEPDSMAFVPGTHLLLFNTGCFRPDDPKRRYLHSRPNNDLLIVDAETGEIKQLVAIGQGGNYLSSPDGKLIAIQTPDHIEVITTQGQTVRRNLLTYPANDDYRGIPMSWTKDSRELIVVPPIPVSEIPDNKILPVLRTVWRYALDGRPGVEIRLNPPPVGEALSISPDGSWIAYSYELGYGAINWNPGPGIVVGMYLGNLQDGTSQLLFTPQPESTGYRDVPDSYYGWSSDSVHFIAHDGRDRLFLGSIHREIASLGDGTILGWIDNKYYLFYEGGVVGEVGKQERVNAVEIPRGISYLSKNYFGPVTFVFLKQ